MARRSALEIGLGTLGLRGLGGEDGPESIQPGVLCWRLWGAVQAELQRGDQLRAARDEPMAFTQAELERRVRRDCGRWEPARGVEVSCAGRGCFFLSFGWAWLRDAAAWLGAAVRWRWMAADDAVLACARVVG